MQTTTTQEFIQQETISFPPVQPLASYVFLDGHTASYDMNVYNQIALNTDVQGHVTGHLSGAMLHSTAMQVYIDSYLAETGYVPSELVQIVGSANAISF